MITTTSPRECRRPAIRALSCPLFFRRLMPVTNGCSREAAVTAAQLASGLQSLTMISSNAPIVPDSAVPMRFTSSPTHSWLLYTGTTIERSMLNPVDICQE